MFSGRTLFTKSFPKNQRQDIYHLAQCKTLMKMEVAPRIIKLLIDCPEVECILPERDPTKRVNIARNILKNDLLDGSDVIEELRKLLE